MKNKREVPKEIQIEKEKRWYEVKKEKLFDLFPPRLVAAVQNHSFKKLQYPVKCTYLYGAPRTGKSVQAAWILLEWNRTQFINRGNTDSIYVSVVELLAELRRSYSQPFGPDNSEIQILEKYKKISLLVLDDFGPERTTEWAYQMLYMILCYRYDHMKITIYTSNLSIAELATSLDDDRIPSRIAHECQGNIIEFKNKPYI